MDPTRSRQGVTTGLSNAVGRASAPAGIGVRDVMTRQPRYALLAPCACMLVLLGLVLLPTVRQNTTLRWSFVGADVVLLIWWAVVVTASRRSGRTLLLEICVRRQHYIQACAQGSIFLYWGWYWREVYQAAPLLVAQLAFACAFDILLSWSRRDTSVLGFGPFPVVLSTNLFLWFKPDWFYFQFLMVAVGLLAKELIRWNKDGRRAHVFNPSSFPLSLFSFALILTHSTNLTWGQEIAQTQFWPPHIYLVIFLVSLPGQLLFGVTSMTMSAVVTMFGFGLLYHAITGSYFFFESIPIAIFLGMHLLFTDPSTSPRTELGRIIFGVLYAFTSLALAPALGFYDKLLPVPFLNLSIKWIDRVAQSPALKWLDPAALGRALVPRRRNLAYIGLWTTVFIGMSTTHSLGHTSRGYWLPSWEEACRDGRRRGCEKLATLDETFCRDGESGWACNDLGLLMAQGRYGTPAQAPTLFERACNEGFQPACLNVRLVENGAVGLQQGAPSLADYAVLLTEGNGPVVEPPFALYTRACQQGWMAACENVGLAYLDGRGTERDAVRAAAEFDKACAGGQATACASVAYQYSNGEGVAHDNARALEYLKKGCNLGMTDACRWMKEVAPRP